MKIFAVYSVVILEKKPDWFDDFRLRFDKPYDLHITYKQPCWIDDDEVENIKSKLNNIFQVNQGKIDIEFDRIVASKGEDEKYCIMIVAKKNERLMKIQKCIVHVLKDYRDFLEAETQSYEDNFMPHITIGRDVSEEDWKLWQKKIEDDCLCAGCVDEIVLSVVKEITVDEAKNESNMKKYKI